MPMNNVTPRSAVPYVPRGLDRDSYLAGILDARLDQAEQTHWRERGYRIDQQTGKLVPLNDTAR
jgi:hypothetical protein